MISANVIVEYMHNPDSKFYIMAGIIVAGLATIPSIIFELPLIPFAANIIAAAATQTYRRSTNENKFKDLDVLVTIMPGLFISIVLVIIKITL